MEKNKMFKKYLCVLLNFRVMTWAICAVSLGGVLSSLTAQYLWGMNPCVMCIQQRLALIGITVLSFACVWLPLTKRWAQTLATGLMVVPAAFGLYVAVKQIHLQRLPIEQQPPCGAPWTFRWRDAPLFEWYEPIIRGTGACGEVYQVLGVSLPVWGACFFVAILLCVLGVWVKNLVSR